MFHMSRSGTAIAHWAAWRIVSKSVEAGGCSVVRRSYVVTVAKVVWVFHRED